MCGRDEMRALRRAESGCVQAAQLVVAAAEGRDLPAPARVELARTLQRLAEARSSASAAIVAAQKHSKAA